MFGRVIVWILYFLLFIKWLYIYPFKINELDPTIDSYIIMYPSTKQ